MSNLWTRFPKFGIGIVKQPIFDIFVPTNANLFHAMGNNPITYKDPDGRAPRSLTDSQRNTYKTYISITSQHLSNIPESYDCTDVTLFLYDNAMLVSTNKKNAYKEMYHNGQKLLYSKFGLTDIQAKDQNPELGNQNILFYDGDGYSSPKTVQAVYDNSFDSKNVEIGTVLVLKPNEKAKEAFTGHTMTVAGFATDKKGNRTDIIFIEGGMNHPPQLLFVNENMFNAGIYSDCDIIGWGEWKTE